MECFYHPGVAAAGICKSCGKGICRTCAVDLGKGLACRGKCEDDAADVIDLLERNIRNAPAYDKILVANQKSRYLSPAFLLIAGFAFVAFGCYQYVSNGDHLSDPFLPTLGVIFLFVGMLHLWRALRYPKLPSRSTKG